MTAGIRAAADRAGANLRAADGRTDPRGSALKHRLPSLLGELERYGVTELRAWPESLKPAITELHALGVVNAWQSGTEYSGSTYATISLPPDQVGGFAPETGEPLAGWLCEWVADPRRADNLRKLDESCADERHLFVVVFGFGDVPFPSDRLADAL